MAKGRSNVIYMDYQATTPLDRRALDAMMPFLTAKFGNPHSSSHVYGWEAADAVERARGRVASLIGAAPKEVIFTSGATESNNLALKGVARAYRGRKSHIVTVATEHKCVLESCKALDKEGFRTTYLKVDGDGNIDLDALDDAISEDTLLVSAMAVNNEIGVISPLSDIGALCRRRKVFFHSDAAQGLGKIPLDVVAMNVDLMSLSGHKIYGPKGIGALFVNRRSRVRLDPLMSGGGQEAGLRSGTLAPALCVGFGEACAIAADEMASEGERIAQLARRFRDGVASVAPGFRLNGDAKKRYAGNVNVAFEGADGDRLISELRELAVSSGAACASASHEPSYVLRAIGLPKAMIRSSIRFGIGRFTTDEDIERAIAAVGRALERMDGAAKSGASG